MTLAGLFPLGGEVSLKKGNITRAVAGQFNSG